MMYPPLSISSKATYRFTVLTDRLIRCEYQPDGVFEDRPTQWIVSRSFPEVPCETQEIGDRLTMETSALSLEYKRGTGPFTEYNLSIRLKNGAVWRFGDLNSSNLGGAARTLDMCDGNFNRRYDAPLEMYGGVFSRDGWAVLDDSQSMVINAEHFPESRGRQGVQDFYFFAYETDFSAGLKDFYALTGHSPLIPEWALGLWWCRWEKYRDADLRAIVNEFKENGAPLSVLVLDMDWHVRANPYTTGWTGYTWDKNHFPDPEGFLAWLHQRGIRAALNLHPASGVHPHEDAYRAFAEFMGVDPESKLPILFNPTCPKFLEGYFRFLHHPHEALGVNFWWIDWQQGKKSPFGDIDPLWVLNHLHSADLARNGDRRPFTFSRWCGAGAHRYPIGFSGDTYRTWRSLEWQVEFTAQAANLGFGWWSHDIGGHARGIQCDDELYLRWVQWGALSPILRFHNGGDPTMNHFPWTKDARYREPALAALKLRRTLKPYLYTAARENAQGGFPVVRPLYYTYPHEDEAYAWKGQYFLGNDLLCAPITQAAHPETGHILHPVWLPDGSWCDFNTGMAYEGGRVHGLIARETTLPVFVKAGTIIPTTSPQEMLTELICFPGESGRTSLYVDDGNSLEYQQGNYALWSIQQEMVAGTWTLEVTLAEGSLDQNLLLCIKFRGWKELDFESLSFHGKTEKPTLLRDENDDFYLQVGSVDADGIVIEGRSFGAPLEKPAPDHRGCVELLARMPINCHFTRPIVDNWEQTRSNPASLSRFVCDLTPAQLRLLVNYLYDAGFALADLGNKQYHLFWWNAHPTLPLKIALSTREECKWEFFSQSTCDAPPFGSHPLPFKSGFHSWRCECDLLEIATIIDSSNK